MPDPQDLVGVLVEGETDLPAVDSLLASCGLARDAARTIVALGKGQLDSRIASVNRNARRQRWFVLRDLDRDGGRCALVLRRSLLAPERQEPDLVLRIAVTSLESWLLADSEAFAEHFKVPLSKVPGRPDDLDDAKVALVNACRSSQSRAVRAGMVPPAQTRRRVGPEYVALIGDYCREAWRPTVAATGSPSLERALRDIRRRFGGDS
ncbi:hypothetical protein [Quadrisphaera setariae]|uniref:DUF4276 family protein n=1 Tax=Quadrisphaera setariae TaxID=2593304 RepID=A0A5C8ZDG9_9ACTN|nr:hypothetical protein [Quadrisphaera setariae]TXR55208.1 hypothetical protein FMM08_15060 [Quadrisphaera setariae]